jgi:hypothetical protein
MYESTFDESTLDDESTFEADQVSDLDCVKYAYARHLTVDIFDEHPLTARDEFLACVARHAALEDNALASESEVAGEATAAEFDEVSPADLASRAVIAAVAQVKLSGQS